MIIILPYADWCIALGEFGRYLALSFVKKLHGVADRSSGIDLNK